MSEENSFCKNCLSNLASEENANYDSVEQGVPRFASNLLTRGVAPTTTEIPPQLTPLPRLGVQTCCLPKKGENYVDGKCAFVLYPTGYDGDQNGYFEGKLVTGCIVVDSFLELFDSNGDRHYVHEELLLDLYERTGQVFMAVARGGSALLHPSGGGLAYANLLKLVPGNGIQHLLIIASGNDLYNWGQVR